MRKVACHHSQPSSCFIMILQLPNSTYSVKKIPKSFSSFSFLPGHVEMSPIYFVLLTVTFVDSKYHRLQVNAANSELQIVPRIELPISLAPNIQSGMIIRLPISLKFPGRQDSSTNSRQMTDGNVTKAEGRALFYRSLEGIHPNLGRVCLLRSICEVAATPLMNPAAGLFGEVVDLLLTCSHLIDSNHILQLYREAENFGRTHSGNHDACRRKFVQCPFSVFNVVNLSSLFE